MLSFRKFISEKTEDHSHLKNHPLEKMRDYNEHEFPWEYREYTKYAKGEFPHAFDSPEHFKAKYDAAPLRHLEPHELKHLDYSTAGSWMDNRPGKKEAGHKAFQNHRKLDRIYHQFKTETPPPIVLKHSGGMRILGGNTRLSLGLAHNINLPVKVIDISDRH